MMISGIHEQVLFTEDRHAYVVEKITHEYYDGFEACAMELMDVLHFGRKTLSFKLSKGDDFKSKLEHQIGNFEILPISILYNKAFKVIYG